MKILMVNKYHYLRGGSERYQFELTRLLESHGHDVVFLSTSAPENEDGHEAMFIDGVDFDRSEGTLQSVATALRVIYSRTARRAMEAAVDRYRPDVVHLHNIAHHFSPSILLALGARGVPAVQTLHDFKLVCPTYRLLSHGRICERCAGGRYHHVLTQRCNRGSLARSAVNAVESYLHAFLHSYRHVDRFLCPSRFLLNKVAELGAPRERLEHTPLFIDTDAVTPHPEPGAYAVFVGRLSPEKGLRTLLEAASLAPDVPLRIVGNGPARGELEAFRAARQLRHVEFLGRLEGAELERVWGGAAFTVVPSEWYENFPMTVLESMALAKPVLASALGGLEEMVADGDTGRLVPAGDPERLASAMRELMADRALLADMGRRARQHARAEWTPERHYQRLLAIYSAVGAQGAPEQVAP